MDRLSDFERLTHANCPRPGEPCETYHPRTDGGDPICECDGLVLVKYLAIYGEDSTPWFRRAKA